MMGERWAAPGSPTTWVYFAQQGIGPGKPIKIGKANYPRKRVSSLASGNPEGVYLLATIPAINTTEDDIHWEFRSVCISREWFKPHPDLVHFIIWIAEPASCLKCRFGVTMLWDRHCISKVA
jgi:hypothetical protein